MGLELDGALEFARRYDHGVLVTLRRDGRPQLSNVLYHVGDDGTARMSVTDSRAKTTNLRRDPRAALHVTREDFYAYVVLDGTVTLSPVVTDPDDAAADELVDLYRSLRGEHPDWDEYRQVMVSEGRVVARLRVDSAYGMLGS